MKKYIFISPVFLSIFLTGCFNQKTEHSINAELNQKCRGGNMEFLDTYECVNLTVDKLKIVQESDFENKRNDIKNCIGEDNTMKLISLNEVDIKLVEKSRPSVWSHYIPFVSPKKSTLSRVEEIKGSDEHKKSVENRKAFINNLQDSQKKCLRNTNSLQFITRVFYP